MNTSNPRRISPVGLLRAASMTFASLSLAWSAGAIAHEPGAHVHGTAELQVAIDGNQLTISFESPLDNLIGFEHPPRTDKERSAVKRMATRLRQAQTLFVTTPAAQCTLASVQLVSAALPADLLGETKPTKADGAKEEEGHADLDAAFTFNCANISQLKGMDVGLMPAFPGLRKLNVQVVGPRGQSATVLVPGKRALAW